MPDSPLDAHAATPRDLQERIAAERRGTPFLIYRDADVWINGGFFAFRPELFDYLHDDEDLVEEPFARLIEHHKLRAHRHHGFWAAMDTMQDKVTFDEIEASGMCVDGT